MKKTIGVSLLALIIIVFGILPFGMGFFAERMRAQAMNTFLPDNSPVSFKLVSYQRHWFTSDVVYNVTLTALAAHPTAASMPTGITVTEKVYHGPIILTTNLKNHLRVYFAQAVAKGTLVLNPAGTKFSTLMPQVQVNPAGPFRELTLLGMTGRIHVNLGLPAMTVMSTASNSQGNTLKLSPAELYVSATNNLQKLSAGIKLQTANVLNQNNPIFSMRNLGLHLDLEKSPQQLWLGTGNLRIADMSEVFSGRHVDVRKLSIQSKSSIESKLLSSITKFHLDTVVIDGREFGPGVITLSFKRFDPNAQAALASLRNRPQPQNPWQQAALLREMSQLFSQLIAQGATVSLNPVNLKTTDGDVALRAYVKFPNVAGKSASLPQQLHNTDASLSLKIPKVIANKLIDVANRQQIQTQMEAGVLANGSVDIDAMVATQRTTEINNWLNRGYIVSNGSNYTVSVAYKQGGGYLNGKTLNQVFGLPAVIAPAATAPSAIPGTSAGLPAAMPAITSALTPAAPATQTTPAAAMPSTSTVTTAPMPAVSTPTAAPPASTTSTPTATAAPHAAAMPATPPVSPSTPSVAAVAPTAAAT